MHSQKLKIEKSKWAGKRVLVTGHTGFMGSWLCLVLKKLGCKICGVSLEPVTNPSLFSFVKPVIDQHFIINIQDYKELQSKLESEKFDYVFHLAAQPLVRLSYELPIETFSTNVMGTAHVLELVKNCFKPDACLVVTSDKCYKNQESLRPYVEDDPLGGHDPYSASKAATEIVVESYRKSYFEKLGIPLASVRAGNIIGGGDWSEDRIIPDLMKNFFRGQSVEIRSPDSVRPWQHVLEPIFVYIGLMQAMSERLISQDNRPMSYAKAWNIGPDESSCRNVKELSEASCRTLGLKSEEFLRLKNPIENTLHEAKFLQIDSNLLKNTFHWRSTLDFEKTVQWTVNWYKDFHNGKNAFDLCNAQINQYIQLSHQTFDYVI